MLHTLKNDHMSVTASDHGAELRSVMCHGVELLWQGDPQWWIGRAPILFPVVGQLYGGAYSYNSQRYMLRNHGFARHSDFVLTLKTDDKMSFLLRDNEDTQNVFPFAFALLVTYTLSDCSLRTDFQVTNTSDACLYFSIGGHPAFRCPLFQRETFEDYEIVFNERETAGNHLLSDENLVLEETAPFFNNSNTIPLDYNLFRQYETLVFSDLKSTRAMLRQRETGAGVDMDFTSFPFFGIWTPPGAPFICLEPWQGVDDFPGFTGDLRDKRGIICLEPKRKHSCGFSLRAFIVAKNY